MAPDDAEPELDRRLAETADLVTVAVDALLPRTDGPEARLTEAMRYAVLGPSRRLRPFYVVETARMYGVEDRAALRAACAVECVHVAAQTQDDLPALDDARARDGRPALHRAYDLATALLAVDALKAAAFEMLAHRDTHEDAAVRVELVRKLAVAAGARGAAGGRMIESLGPLEDTGAVARMQRMKTGALIAFAVEAPLVLARAEGPERAALMAFATDLSLGHRLSQGLQALGKPRPAAGAGRAVRSPSPGLDLAASMGAPQARERLSLLAEQCRRHLDIFGGRARYLRDSVDFVLDRRA